ncbi:MAG: DNA-binding protein [Bacteroidota bacterium]
MAINFKVIQKGQPGVAGGGEKKYYATPVLDGELTLPELTRAIEKICTVSGADILAVLYAMVDVSVDNLANGTIVRLGELGSLRPTLSSEGKATEAEVSSSSVKNAGILFAPGTRIKQMLETVKFKKV